MYKIIFRKKECIGAGECASLAPHFWKMKEGKADLMGAKLNSKTGYYELEIEDDEMDEHQVIADSCPVACIEIIKT